MSGTNKWTAGAFLVCSIAVAGCEPKGVKATEAKPVHIEAITGTELHRVTLSSRAAERLDVTTGRVEQRMIRGLQRKVVPYAAVLYDSHGDTWVFTNPEPLVYVRHRIHVDFISTNQAVLTDGPAVGTTVVTVGAVELFGAEFEIGH